MQKSNSGMWFFLAVLALIGATYLWREEVLAAIEKGAYEGAKAGAEAATEKAINKAVDKITPSWAK